MAPVLLDVPVRLHTVLTGFQLDAVSLVADSLLALFLLADVAATIQLSRRRRRGGWACLSFSAGIVVLFLAIGSGIAAYDDINFPMHVLQHLLLMMLAPPLLALGRPLTTLAQASPRRLQRLVVAVVNSRPARALVSWPIWPVYFAAMWAAFLSPIYRLDLENEGIHDATHLVLVLLGYCYWQGVVGLEPSPRRASPGRRVAALMAGGPVEAAIGVWLLITPRPLFRSTLAATHLGGGVFLVGAMLISGLALALVLFDWARRDEQRVLRLDEVMAREATALAPDSLAAPPVAD